MTRARLPRMPFKRLRGALLLETLMALTVGGILMMGGAVGMREYNEGVKVQASASMLKRLTLAADAYAGDNYQQLLTEAPREYPSTVLEPYYGNNIGTDAFKNSYVLTTRTYKITVPNPSGGTIQKDALQLLVVAKKPASSPINSDPLIKAEVANTTGAAGGFISDADLSCPNATGTGQRIAGQICGSFGGYSFAANQFPSTNFSDAAFVTLTTKGDSMLYGDQLYRYDQGDPDLNRMHTNLDMNNNDILNVDSIDTVDRIVMAGPNKQISTNTGGLSLKPKNNLWLEPENGKVFVRSNDGSTPQLNASLGTLQIGANSHITQFGAPKTFTHGPSTAQTGQGTIFAGTLNTDRLRANEINSLHQRENDPLRLQNFDNGEVIVGRRVRYNPKGDNTAGGTYELSDGQLTAQHVRVQDITCADCGGTLSSILPKWRQMGTYYVNANTDVNRAYTAIPYPNCTANRRSRETRGAVGTDVAYNEFSDDSRYSEKIILIPKRMGTGVTNNRDENFTRTIEWKFEATRRDGRREWDVRVWTQNAGADALAVTYCVFEGGNSSPTAGSGGALHRSNTNTNAAGTWTRID
jgi:hypothetical protein